MQAIAHKIDRNHCDEDQKAGVESQLGRTRDELLGQPVMQAFDAGPGTEASENARQLSVVL